MSKSSRDSTTIVDADGARCACGSTRRTYTFHASVNPEDPGRFARRSCCGCRRVDSVDVAFDVPIVLRTIAQRRAWWAKIAEQRLLPSEARS